MPNYPFSFPTFLLKNTLNGSNPIFLFNKKWFSLLFSLIVFYLLIDYASYTGIKFFTYLLFIFGFIILLINLRWGVYYYIIISLLSDDTSRIIELPDFNSIHFSSIGSLTLISYLTIFMFFVALAHFFVHKKKLTIIFLDKIIIGLILLYFIAGVIGLPNLLQFPRGYIENASYVINLAIFYFTIRLIITNEKKLRNLICFIVSCFVVKAIVGLFYYYFGFGVEAGENIRVFYESGGHLLGLPFLWLSIFLAFFWSKIQRNQKLILVVFIFSILFQIITFGSRENIILLGFSIFLVLLLMFNWSLRIQKRTLVIYGIFVILLVGSILIGIHISRPGALDYVGWKLESTLEIDIGAERLSSVSVRVLAAQNIWHHLYEKGNLLWGEGLGGWFSDKYKPYFYKVLGGDAYPDEQIVNRQVFKPHGTLLVVFLKMGIIGFIIFYFLLTVIFIHGYNIFKSTKDLSQKIIALGATAFLPLFFNKLYTSKMQVFFGILLAILACIYILNKEKNKKYQKREQWIDQK